MNSSRASVSVCVVVVIGLLAGTANAVPIVIETVPVGNPGNAGELSGNSAGGTGPDAIVGGVDYIYNIGKYEVTAGQWTSFLNAVARTDTYGLYNRHMADPATPYVWGCNIQQSGPPGSYTYSVAPDYANRPVNWVSWGDSARFANWMHNNQPTGAQGLSTTEDGAYYLNGATTNEQLLAANRKAVWRWAITSEDEWYKGAYYNPSTSSYFDYPTSSNSITTNMANYAWSVEQHTTDVGSYGNSSPYGTFDQGGNLWEWNEAEIFSTPFGKARGLRGGAFYSLDFYLRASVRSLWLPTEEYYDMGFRVSEVPEPATLALLAVGGLALMRRKQGAVE